MKNIVGHIIWFFLGFAWTWFAVSLYYHRKRRKERMKLLASLQLNLHGKFTRVGDPPGKVP